MFFEKIFRNTILYTIYYFSKAFDQFTERYAIDEQITWKSFTTEKLFFPKLLSSFA